MVFGSTPTNREKFMDKSIAAQWAMCQPQFYNVEYEINSWMKGNIGLTDQKKAQQQWNALYNILCSRANIKLIPPAPGLPDFTFTANAGLVFDNAFISARFRHIERQREEPHFQQWFQQQGYTIIELDGVSPFEGEGDALFQPDEPLLWLGYGMRTHLDTQKHLSKILNTEVISLHLINSHFYHLDTCFAPLPNGGALYYPPAFDGDSLEKLCNRIPAHKRIEVSDEDAVNFACNAIICQNAFICNYASAQLRNQLLNFELEVITTPLTEFMLAGGAAKCLALCLTTN